MMMNRNTVVKEKGSKAPLQIKLGGKGLGRKDFDRSCQQMNAKMEKIPPVTRFVESSAPITGSAAVQMQWSGVFPSLRCL